MAPSEPSFLLPFPRLMSGEALLKHIFIVLGLLISCIGCGEVEKAPLHSYQERPLRALLAPGYPDEIPDLDDTPSETYADVLRAVYGLRPEWVASSDFEKVTQRFGRTVIDMNTLPYQSPVHDSGLRPWSAWWYPKFEKTLFENPDGEATLVKYDRYRQQLYRNEGRSPPIDSAATIERTHHDSGALKWEGLCNAWSFASLLRPEPTRIFRHRLPTGIVSIDVADQKALLMKSFEGIEDSQIDVWGQKFTGDDRGWIHPDPFPDQFHRFIEEMLVNRREAFIMDHEAGVEIWNVPVYKANYKMEAVPGRDDAVQVRMWLYAAAPLRKEQIQEVGLKETLREYHYVLLGRPLGAGRLEVVSGVWIKGPNGTDSRKSHPDYFMTIPDKERVTRQSFNAAIEARVVDKITSGEGI